MGSKIELYAVRSIRTQGREGKNVPHQMCCTCQLGHADANANNEGTNQPQTIALRLLFLGHVINKWSDEVEKHSRHRIYQEGRNRREQPDDRTRYPKHLKGGEGTFKLLLVAKFCENLFVWGPENDIFSAKALGSTFPG
jgi:hypothetical protein